VNTAIVLWAVAKHLFMHRRYNASTFQAVFFLSQLMALDLARRVTALTSAADNKATARMNRIFGSPLIS
jgi:hypothetical protein